MVYSKNKKINPAEQEIKKQINPEQEKKNPEEQEKEKMDQWRGRIFISYGIIDYLRHVELNMAAIERIGNTMMNKDVQLIILLSLFINGFLVLYLFLAKELVFSFIRYLEKNNVLFGFIGVFVLLFSLIVLYFFAYSEFNVSQQEFDVLFYSSYLIFSGIIFISVGSFFFLLLKEIVLMVLRKIKK